MNVKHFRWLFLAALVVVIYWASTMSPGTIGISQSCTDGVCHFEGGTAPRAIACAFGIILLYILFLYSPPASPGAPMPGLLRRFVAFWVDFILFMAATAPLAGIAPTLLEWRRTGVFAWNFARDVSAPYDGWLSAIVVLVLLIFMPLYFALPLVRARPSPGSCIMGYQILSDIEGGLTLMEALKRVCFGFMAVCSAYFVNSRPRDKSKGKFWLDMKFGTHAVMLT
jgi:RDD family